MIRRILSFVFAAWLMAVPSLVMAAPSNLNFTGEPVPSPSNFIGLTGVTSTAAENAHVIKATPGNLYSAYAANITGTAGFLIIVNAAVAPSTGALSGATVLDCVPLPANGVASINYAPSPPKVYSIGMVALLSSATTCFTWTTGTITGFISGSAP